MIKMVHYLYVLSSWSFIAEDMVTRVRERFGAKLEYDWRIAVTDYSGEGPYSRERLQFFYDRLEAATGQRVNLGWWSEGYDWLVPDRVVAAARLLGATNSDVRLALANAGLRDGRQITQLAVAVEIAAEASDIPTGSLLEMAAEPRTTMCLFEWSREFLSSGVTLRPAFQLINDLGDRVVLSGIWNAAPLMSSIESLLTDEESYEVFVSERTLREPS